MDLSPIKKAIKVIFTNGRLDTIQLESIFLSGNIAFSSDGSKMALSIYRYTDYYLNGVYIFNLTNGQIECFIPDRNNNVVLSGFAFNPDGSIFATAYDDGLILLRKSNTGEVIHELRTIDYKSGSTRISFSSGASLMATSGYFQPIRVWNMDTGQIIFDSEISNIENKVTDAALSPDGKLLGKIVFLDGIKVANLVVDKAEVAMEGSEDERYLLFSVDGDYIYSLNHNSEVTVWDSWTGRKIKTLNLFTEPCLGYCGWEVETRMTISTDGSRLLMEDPLKIILWDTRTWQELLNGRNEDVIASAPIVDASINPAGNMIAINYNYSIVRFWYLAP
jgi:WD40 repeat protein